MSERTKKTIPGGLFIVHEGGEGAGKTTRAQALQARLQGDGYEVEVTREPGGTPLGQRLRQIVLDPDLAGAIKGLEGLFLFAADTHAHVRQIIRPALAAGRIVICDRYTYSSQVYQQLEGVPAAAIDQIIALSTGGLRPDRAYWYDVTPEIGLSRLAAEKRAELTKYDAAPLTFHHDVRAGFHRLWQDHPHEITRIDADRPDQEVTNAVYADIRQLIHAKLNK